MTVPSPFEQPGVWDTLVIGGVPFRGTFEFGGDLLKRRLDHRKASGRDGARIRDKGYDLAEIDLALKVYTQEHWDDLQALIALLFPRSGEATRRNAHDCAHPSLALAGITQVYASKMGALRQTSPTLWEVTINLVEYRPEAQRRNVSHTARAVPDVSTNATAFTGTEAPPAPPAAPTPPATPGPSSRGAS